MIDIQKEAIEAMKEAKGWKLEATKEMSRASQCYCTGACRGPCGEFLGCPNNRCAKNYLLSQKG